MECGTRIQNHVCVCLAHYIGLLRSLNPLRRGFLPIECQQHWLSYRLDESDCAWFRSDLQPLSFILIDQQSEKFWLAFLQWVQNSPDWHVLDFDHCRSPLVFYRLWFRSVLSACCLDRLCRSIESVEWWASADSSMVSPIDFHRISLMRFWLIVSSKFSLRQLLANVVQNTSQLTSRLENRARAFTCSLKLIIGVGEDFVFVAIKHAQVCRR